MAEMSENLDRPTTIIVEMAKIEPRLNDFMNVWPGKKEKIKVVRPQSIKNKEVKNNNFILKFSTLGLYLKTIKPTPRADKKPIKRATIR